MQMGVLNYSAAARYIQEEVQSLLQKEMELNTIVATLTRIAKVMDELPVIDRQEMFHKSRVYLTTGMAQVQIDVGTEGHRDIMDKLAESQLMDIDNLSVHQFPSCIRILCSSNDADVIHDTFTKYSVTVKKGCALLNMRLQSSVKEDSASIAYTIDLLNRNGINILATYSVHDDILVVVEENDISRALELLHLASKALT
jgi:aspartokinase